MVVRTPQAIDLPSPAATPDADPSITWNFRLQTIVSVKALLRVIRAAMEAYGDDIEAIVIFLAASAASVDAVLRDPELAQSPPPGPVPVRHLRAVSRRAIAASTGLPRETVRRKVAVLIERGLLVADGPRVRIPPGLLDVPYIGKFTQEMVQEFIRVGGQLERLSTPDQPAISPH